jgi:hypothetical protein
MAELEQLQATNAQIVANPQRRAQAVFFLDNNVRQDFSPRLIRLELCVLYINIIDVNGCYYRRGSEGLASQYLAILMYY